MYTHQQIDERLQRERAQRIEREFAAYDAPDKSLDEALDKLEGEEARKREAKSILTNVTAEGERSYKGIKI